MKVLAEHVGMLAHSRCGDVRTVGIETPGLVLALTDRGPMKLNEEELSLGIEPSQARYRSTVAMQRLANALGIQLRAEEDDCLCLERLAAQAERWRRFDSIVTLANSTRLKAYAAGYDSDEALRGEGEP